MTTVFVARELLPSGEAGDIVGVFASRQALMHHLAAKPPEPHERAWLVDGYDMIENEYYTAYGLDGDEPVENTWRAHRLQKERDEAVTLLREVYQIPWMGSEAAAWWDRRLAFLQRTENP